MTFLTYAILGAALGAAPDDPPPLAGATHAAHVGVGDLYSTPYADVLGRVRGGEKLILLVKTPRSDTLPVKTGWTTLRCDDAPFSPGEWECWPDLDGKPWTTRHHRASIGVVGVGHGAAAATVPGTVAVGVHDHRCPRCGFKWTHSDASFGDPAAHTCPNCGRLLPRPWEQVPGSSRVEQRVAGVAGWEPVTQPVASPAARPRPPPAPARRVLGLAGS